MVCAGKELLDEWWVGRMNGGNGEVYVRSIRGEKRTFLFPTRLDSICGIGMNLYFVLSFTALYFASISHQSIYPPLQEWLSQ